MKIKVSKVIKVHVHPGRPNSARLALLRACWFSQEASKNKANIENKKAPKPPTVWVLKSRLGGLKLSYVRKWEINWKYGSVMFNTFLVVCKLRIYHVSSQKLSLVGTNHRSYSFFPCWSESKSNLSTASHLTVFLFMFECTDAIYRGTVLGEGRLIVRGRVCEHVCRCEQNTDLRWEHVAEAPSTILLMSHTKALAFMLFFPHAGKCKIRKKSCYKRFVLNKIHLNVIFRI